MAYIVNNGTQTEEETEAKQVHLHHSGVVDYAEPSVQSAMIITDIYLLTAKHNQNS